MKKLVFVALGAMALGLPAAAFAQQYYGYNSYQERGHGYDQPRGDYYQGRGGRTGYPEFRPAEAHILGEIREAARSGDIEPDDARDLYGQLRQIQWREYREFQVHGWNLPDDDRESIRRQLDDLDRRVDEIRDEQ